MLFVHNDCFKKGSYLGVLRVWEVTKSLSCKGQEMSPVEGGEGKENHTHFCGSHLGAGCHDNIVKYIQVMPQSLFYCG